MSKKTNPHGSIVAFRAAQKLAAASAVARFELAAADLTYEHDEFYNNLAAVRRALINGYRAHGGGASDDYDGDRFQQTLPPDQSDEFFAQLTHREEAGYMYGLALGLLLGRGGAR